MQILRVVILCVFIALVSIPAFAEQLDINSADAEQLAQTLKGVGPQKAVAIVKYRQENGPFRSIDDLTNVKGIGDKVVADNRTRIVANAPVAQKR